MYNNTLHDKGGEGLGNAHVRPVEVIMIETESVCSPHSLGVTLMYDLSRSNQGSRMRCGPSCFLSKKNREFC
ncbi:hypothetical protein CCFV1_ORF070 [Cotesia congregata filamentous virus 1]|uniref:Uncharacterized protein n=1 Tax=Cotesia congregata filamentous virus 1 TaxID=3064291 RepID=A0ABC8QK72_9VIRU|nr:hypothetical protein CCFV1_ORF070 [Cotesia congregata filamentous virus 1]